MKKILFICGSLNQTTQMHQISKELGGYEHRFTPFYGGRVVDAMRRLGLIEITIGGNKRRGWCLDYLRDHGLAIDVEGRQNDYDLVVNCTDMTDQPNIRDKKMVVVQEGILDPETWVYDLVTRLKFLPRWFAGTSTTGLSFAYDRLCVASEGYRQHFLSKGIAPEKVVVTGIPNFDDCKRYCENDFPYRGYVLVCTSDTRETFKPDDRPALIRKALRIAAGRQLIFKLHPNEKEHARRKEILALAPQALVFQKGSAEEMIANADVVITQWSSTVFVGLALGKEVYSNFPMEELVRLCPVQNGGASARNIANVCREVLGDVEPLREAAQ
jgi:hypothetical protein